MDIHYQEFTGAYSGGLRLYTFCRDSLYVVGRINLERRI